MHEELTIKLVYELIYKDRLKYYMELYGNKDTASRKANIIAVKTTWEEFCYLTAPSCMYGEV